MSVMSAGASCPTASQYQVKTGQAVCVHYSNFSPAQAAVLLLPLQLLSVLQVNARRINDEPDVFTGVLSNRFFSTILASEALLQVLIVQFGGHWFQTAPLSPAQWAACTGIGATSLLVRAGLRLIPTNKRN